VLPPRAQPQRASTHSRPSTPPVSPLIATELPRDAQPHSLLICHAPIRAVIFRLRRRRRRLCRRPCAGAGLWPRDALRVRLRGGLRQPEPRQLRQRARVCDGVGGVYAEASFRSIGWDGRFLVIGFPAGIPAIPLNLALLKSGDIVGVFWGAAVARDPKGHAANMAELMQMYAEGKIKPRVSKTFPLEKAGAAIAALGDRQALGKIVVTVGD
jgi:hypothetical protein